MYLDPEGHSSGRGKGGSNVHKKTHRITEGLSCWKLHFGTLNHPRPADGRVCRLAKEAFVRGRLVALIDDSGPHVVERGVRIGGLGFNLSSQNSRKVGLWEFGLIGRRRFVSSDRSLRVFRAAWTHRDATGDVAGLERQLVVLYRYGDQSKKIGNWIKRFHGKPLLTHELLKPGLVTVSNRLRPREQPVWVIDSHDLGELGE